MIIPVFGDIVIFFGAANTVTNLNFYKLVIQKLICVLYYFSVVEDVLAIAGGYNELSKITQSWTAILPGGRELTGEDDSFLKSSHHLS
jgi:hypothetical protein